MQFRIENLLILFILLIVSCGSENKEVRQNGDIKFESNNTQQQNVKKHETTEIEQNGDINFEFHNRQQRNIKKEGTVIDRDGNVYKTIQIGEITWMAENLKVELPGSWNYNNDSRIGREYGRLYSWDAAVKGCPDGWRLPTNREFENLIEKFGGAKIAFLAFIDGGESQLKIQFGGQRKLGEFTILNLQYGGLGDVGYYWSSTQDSSEDSGNYIWRYSFGRINQSIGKYSTNKSSGFSCRCVKGTQVDNSIEQNLGNAILNWNNAEEISKIIDKTPKIVNSVDEKGFLPLGIAVQAGRVDIVELLIEKGALAFGEDQAGQTALHYVPSYNYLSIIQILIDNGANINAKNSWGDTPLHSAVSFRNKEVVEVLIVKGADLNIVNDFGETPMQKAKKSGYDEILTILKAHGGNLKSPRVILLDAISQENFKKVKNLIEGSPDLINTKSLIGSTPLHSAAFVGNTLIGQFLISKGININAVDKDNTTPLHIAVGKQHKEFVKLLVENGADKNIKCGLIGVSSSPEFTPMDLAKLFKLRDIEKILREHK